MARISIGIDNGVSGSCGIITPHAYYFYLMPTKSEQSYTKAKNNITRIRVEALLDLFDAHDVRNDNSMVMIERPMVNPKRFKASVSAIRAFEAVLIAVEMRGLPHSYLDSKEWQRVLLPKGCKGPELKTASIDIGGRLFPDYKNMFEKHKDADGMLIAEHCRRKFQSPEPF